jgi:ATP-dependent Lon protease
MSDTREMGLFPLGMALLPGERVPLHLFEPRYRELFADCTRNDLSFVLVLADDDDRASVGCEARFDELVHRFDDGRINVVVVGVEVVEIGEETSGKDYLTAEVRALADDPYEPQAALETEVRELFRDLSARVTGTPRDLEEPPGVPLSFAAAGTLELGPQIKQELLEQRNETHRLERVRDILKATSEGMGPEHVASERAQRNGKVTHN